MSLSLSDDLLHNLSSGPESEVSESSSLALFFAGFGILALMGYRVRVQRVEMRTNPASGFSLLPFHFRSVQ